MPLILNGGKLLTKLSGLATTTACCCAKEPPTPCFCPDSQCLYEFSAAADGVQAEKIPGCFVNGGIDSNVYILEYGDFGQLCVSGTKAIAAYQGGATATIQKNDNWGLGQYLSACDALYWEGVPGEGLPTVASIEATMAAEFSFSLECLNGLTQEWRVRKYASITAFGQTYIELSGSYPNQYWNPGFWIRTGEVRQTEIIASSCAAAVPSHTCGRFWPGTRESRPTGLPITVSGISPTTVYTRLPIEPTSADFLGPNPGDRAAFYAAFYALIKQKVDDLVEEAENFLNSITVTITEGVTCLPPTECTNDGDCHECDDNSNVVVRDYMGDGSTIDPPTYKCCPPGSVGWISDGGDPRDGNCVSEIAPGDNVTGGPIEPSAAGYCCGGECQESPCPP